MSAQVELLPGLDEKKESEVKNDDLIKSLRERVTSELIFVFTGPLCSGLSTISKKRQKKLKEHSYEVKMIKVSDFILKEIRQNDSSFDPSLFGVSDVKLGLLN